MRKRKGFTLIEIMIVLAIIAILAMRLVPHFVGFDTEAQLATSKANLTTLRTRITMYRAKKGKYPDSLNDLLNDTYTDAGVTRPFLKKIPFELISTKEGSNELEVLTSDQPLSSNGGWTYIKDRAEVVIDWDVALEERWGEKYEGEIPSNW